MKNSTESAVRREVDRARHMYPGPFPLSAVVLKLSEEVGETVRAVMDGDLAHAHEELVQVACVAIRAIEDTTVKGDQSFGITPHSKKRGG